MAKRILAVRQDNNGDVLLAGPALRALRDGCDALTLVCGPRGTNAARLLPGVDDRIVWEAAWIDADPSTVDRADVDAFVDTVRRGRYDEAVIFTSFHQSPLPMALLLRLAAIRRIGAISVDYPGSLLDVRHSVADDMHEVERALSLAASMGYHLAAHDDGRLAIEGIPQQHSSARKYVVVHPGCTVPARAWSVQGNRSVAAMLAESGYDVLVTGSSDESAITRAVTDGREHVCDLGGKTSFAQFAAIVRDAAAVVCGNTSTAHVAAAVGTPVIEIFPPTIPAARFRPWMVPHVLLGDQNIACRGCRARVCPIPGQPCIAAVSAQAVVDAVRSLAKRTAAA
ncbi:MAG: glycosyltransferase family 9 protein [Candidatus Eremiobacteraeota bacterium]|nr:glycosyltransferase family 9 protein [Candidatus Eremiobacteraeota bacterium]